jgi:maltose alpha-D-glucosyltransferase/alpha-amylase
MEDHWYKNTIIYSLDLETFMDANGDGVGDFEGLMRRLDYLQGLGVQTLWLAPFQPSPNRDNGYDISDFYGVDPRHGSSGDFVEFMREAEKRGLRVIIDLVVNHVSDLHRWFQEARDDEDSLYRDWFVWSQERPPDWNTGMVFPGVQKATWTRDEQAGLYYYHRFYDFQPDLNIDNPDVRIEIRRIMGYWLQLGVAGFRVDAVPFIIESKRPGEEARLKFEYLAEMRRFLQLRRGDAILLGEANVLPNEVRKYFGEHQDGIQLMFNFYVNQHLFYALASEDVGPLAKALRDTNDLPPGAQWAQFLRNHDELDLGRLTEKQRQQVFERFGPQKEMQLYDRGIRRRLASMIGDPEKLRMAYSVMLSLPGTPVLRYGDEIGMGEDLSLNERDAVRTPMQWSNEANAGFSSAAKLVHPVIDRGPYSYEQVNVEAQRRDPDSLLNWTAEMLRLRKECPEIGWGDATILDSGAAGVLAVLYQWKGNGLVCIHNFSHEPREVSITPGTEYGDRLVNLLAADESRAAEDGAHHLTLQGFAYRWYRIGGLNHTLRRERC